MLVRRCRAELAAKSAARKEANVENAHQGTGAHRQASNSLSARQMAAVPHTGAFRKAQDRRSQRRAVDNSQSMPELGSKEYNVDDWQDDDHDENNTSGDQRSPSSRHHDVDNAAAHGVLPRLNITQRWDTFDISARCAPLRPTCCAVACT